MLGRLFAIVPLLALNAYFVAAEFALVRSRHTRLEAMSRSGDVLARVALRATNSLSRVLSASQLGITLASLGLGWVAESTIGEVFRRFFLTLPWGMEEALRLSLAATVALAIMTYLHIVFGELAPRAVALGNPEKVVRWLAPPLLAFAWLATPFILVLNFSAQMVLRVVGLSATISAEPVHSPEELRMLVEESHESGALHHQDARMIEGVFEFSEKTAQDVMTPRTKIVAIPIEATLEEILSAVEDGGFSRYPVYEESIDNITGVLLAKDLLRVVARSRNQPADAPPFNLKSILRPTHAVPGSREVEDVLADFKRLKEHISIVLDEYGGTAGIVTMEDLLEEIVGEILDEYDESPARPKSASGEVLVPGGDHIGELNDRYGLTVPDEEYTTIGGFVFGKLGRLPRIGDRVKVDGGVLTVRAMEGRRVDTLALELVAAEDGAGSSAD